MTGPRARRIATLMVWLPVLIYAVAVSRQFFHTVNSAVYLSTDDAVANISYALATEGRYGFLSSPILAGMPRHDGLFSYGPFYFYLSAGLIWLFGYNLVLLRSIHLAVMLAVAIIGGRWFRGVGAGALGALPAIGVLMAFERAQWPMIRPDSLVPLFAVALVVFAGLAIRTGTARYWFGAGLAASCGAFTHLVAWALVPAAVVILGFGLAANAWHDGRWRRPTAVWLPLASVAAGGLLGAAGFYGSFGFRVADQIAFLADYQRYTGSMSSLADNTGSFATLIARHFENAYWYLPYPMAYLVWAVFVSAIVSVIAITAWGSLPHRREALAVLAPPTIVWAAYFASLGVYNNLHAGYALLNQVMWMWVGAALVAVAVMMLEQWPSWRRAAVVAVWIVSVAGGVGMLTVLAQRTNYRALAAETMTPIDQYLDHVLEAMPARARAFGSVMFGIEHPGRIQLVQFWDGVQLVYDLAPERRRRLSPDYLVWGDQDSASSNDALIALNGVDRLQPITGHNAVGPWRLGQLFPDTRYRLVSITAAPPYGITRVYAWDRGVASTPRPIVAVYDPTRRQWNTGVGAPQPVAVTPAPPVLMRGNNGDTPAVQTLQGNLDAGLYLLRVELSPALTPDHAVVVLASSGSEVRSSITQPSSGQDVSPWLAGEPEVHLIYQHAGGPLFVSQFGTNLPALRSVAASPIVALADYRPLRRELPPEQALGAGQWTASFPEISVAPAAGGRGVAVAGNATLYGYQAYGPRIAVQPGQQMRLRVPVTVSEGRGCLGVLDETEMRWLLAPDRLLPEYEFQVNDSRTVKPVLADCSGSPAAVTPLRAVIGDGSYALWSNREELYVDELVREFRSGQPR